MLAAALAMALTTTCQPQLVDAAPGENHVMFHGLSPDGRKLAVGWDRGSGAGIRRGAYLLDLRTGQRTDLPHLNNAPSFSPDGRHLISANYAADRSLKTELVELDLRDGSARIFASGPSAEWLGSYSSDARWILFNSTRTGTSDLYRVRRADAWLERLTDDPRYEAHAQFFDRDRKVIFHRQVAGDDYDIVIRDLGRRTERAVGSTPAEEAYPAMSPDGRWIAFSAVVKAGRQPNLFIMRADGSGRRQLTDGPSKDAYATWARDGRSITFVRFDVAGSKILRLAVRNGTCVN
jgi:Tol biopolymer transport system component